MLCLSADMYDIIFILPCMHPVQDLQIKRLYHFFPYFCTKACRLTELSRIIQSISSSFHKAINPVLQHVSNCFHSCQYRIWILFTMLHKYLITASSEYICKRSNFKGTPHCRKDHCLLSHLLNSSPNQGFHIFIMFTISSRQLNISPIFCFFNMNIFC